MDSHPSMSIDRLISAAKFIEQANSILQRNALDQEDDCRLNSTIGKQRVLPRRSFLKASTSEADHHPPNSRSTFSLAPSPYATTANAAPRHSRYENSSLYACVDSSSFTCSAHDLLPHDRGPFHIDHAMCSVADSNVFGNACRAAHNELEKTRRANLRGYLDKLKSIIPASCESTRYTTLSLLTQARDYIMDLQERTHKAAEERSRLKQRRLELQALIEKARNGADSRAAIRPESASTISAIDENEERFSTSPVYLEYSPSAKPALSDGGSSPPTSALIRTPPVDPYLDGLLPALPLFYPRISLYPYLDIKTHPIVSSFSNNSTLLPVPSAVL
ncbi:unnamed protein product [Anisakis simplex]|uniref:MAD-like-1 homolog (inferred by orthology to a C. elegans protein) n=1 Tax=Anisakis simplex TaxID=6269 RepID=A0A0M3JZ48_ANISI|nr:unnamed protein product [Anisakis simplex]